MSKVSKMKYKLPKGNVLYTRYYSENGASPTHILTKKEYAEDNKMWTLFSVGDDDVLTKIIQGNNPNEMENKIPYIKNQKEKCI